MGGMFIKREKVVMIIAGSRDCPERASLVDRAMCAAGWVALKVDIVRSGKARGGDRCGELWAVENKVLLQDMPADWNTHGRSAGYKRNEEMARGNDVHKGRATHCLILWDGASKGSAHMRDIAVREGLQTYVFRIDKI